MSNKNKKYKILKKITILQYVTSGKHNINYSSTKKNTNGNKKF